MVKFHYIPATIFWASVGLKNFVSAQHKDINVDFEISAMEILDSVLQDTTTFNNVLDHGCWCAKLDPQSNHDILGGINPLDEMDFICKEWFLARHCNDSLNGGTCTGIKPISSQIYEFEYSDPNARTCNLIDNDDSRTHTDCEMDACKIDKYYSELIEDYLNDAANSGWSTMQVDNFDTCLLGEGPLTDRVCSGSAPNLKIVPAE